MPEHYTVKAGVIISSDIKVKIKKIADNYNQSTSKDIVVTSGTRESQSQAAAMYGKLSGGDTLTIYKDKTSAKAIKKAYDDAVTAKKNKTQTISAIKTVIDEQIKKGVYISKHLKKGAVDVRSRDMSAGEKAKFKEATKGIASSVLLEVVPPHFHLQF